MILKIERYPGNKEKQDWWLLDDIRKISKTQFEQPFTKDFDANESDIFILDYGFYLDKINAEKDSREVVTLICRLTGGGEYVITFDTTAYILNDNGKTIEKIVVNHK
jgi:hypothetical protein